MLELEELDVLPQPALLLGSEVASMTEPELNVRVINCCRPPNVRPAEEIVG